MRSPVPFPHEAICERISECVHERDKGRREHAPAGDCMQRGEAELLEELPRLFAKQNRQRVQVEGQSRGAKQIFTETDAQIHDGDVRRPEELIQEVDDRLIQFERDACRDAEQRGRAEDREQRAGATDGERERDLFWCDSLYQLRANRIANPALPERARGYGNFGRMRGRWRHVAMLAAK